MFYKQKLNSDAIINNGYYYAGCRIIYMILHLIIFTESIFQIMTKYMYIYI